MARKRVVSRTIATTKATCMVCDTVNAKVENKLFTLSQKIDKDDVLKAAQKAYDTDTMKIVSVVSVEYDETLYAMPELEFLKYAKPVSKEEVDDTEE